MSLRALSKPLFLSGPVEFSAYGVEGSLAFIWNRPPFLYASLEFRFPCDRHNKPFCLALSPVSLIFAFSPPLPPIFFCALTKG